MSEQEKSLAPQRTDGADQDWAIEPTGAPEEFGFPEKPTIQQLTSWHNQERFLEAFSNNGCLKYQAAEACGLTVWAVERWDSTDLYGFKKRYHAAKERLLERYEASCDEDALIGQEKPIIHKGEVLLRPDGTPYTYRERDKLTRMFRMKKLDPAYKDNYQPQAVQDNRSVTIINNFPSGPRQLSTNQGVVVEGESREIPEARSDDGRDGPGYSEEDKS